MAAVSELTISSVAVLFTSLIFLFDLRNDVAKSGFDQSDRNTRQRRVFLRVDHRRSKRAKDREKFCRHVYRICALQHRSSFTLPWSAYVRLLSVKNENARRFYETEALRGGWSVRQLDRQINSQFYERIALSRNKAAMLSKGEKATAEDIVRPEEEIKDSVRAGVSRAQG